MMFKRFFVLVILIALSPVLSSAKVSRVVLGYSSAWADLAHPPVDYNYDGLTYLARAFLKPTADGAVVAPENYFNPQLEKLAHQHGVKLLMSIGGGGAGGSAWLKMATNGKNRDRFIKNLRQLMEEHHYDGVDIDWEPADPNQADAVAQAVLLQALRKNLPGAVITTALPTDDYSTRFIVWHDVIASVDYVNAMAYDYSGPWGGIAGHATNLFPAGDYARQTGHSVQEGMTNLIVTHHVPPQKLLLGMNFFGYRFRVNRIGDHFTPNAPGVSDDLSYQQCLDLLQSGHYQARWDEKAAAAYLERAGGGGIVSYENPDSIQRKCEYAKQLDCAGVMVWGLGSDMTGAQSPLLDAITHSFGGTTPRLSRVAVESQITEAGEQITRANAKEKSTPVPKDLSVLTFDQLVSLNAILQHQAGIANDVRWQSNATANPE